MMRLCRITNSYQDVRLVSLKAWKNANEIEPRDRGGPYMVTQEGYDPLDPKCTPDEFLLGKSGQWISLGLFFKVPQESRRQEFVFGTAAEVMALLESMPSDPKLVRPGEQPAEPAAPSQDDLHAAFMDAKQKPSGAAAS